MGWPLRLRDLIPMQDYHSLEIWQRAMTYAVELYKLTAQRPAW